MSALPSLRRGQRMQVLAMLRRTGPLPVAPLAARLGMSYMGVKAHCQALERDGLLESANVTRAEKRVGRPELAYRLTPKGQSHFPPAGNDLVLELLAAVHRTLGPAGPEKLLFAVFQDRSERARQAIPPAAPLPARARALAELRDAEGHLAELRHDEATGALGIVEAGAPLGDLHARFPALMARLEREFFERVLGVPVRREEAPPAPGAPPRVIFHLPASPFAAAPAEEAKPETAAPAAPASAEVRPGMPFVPPPPPLRPATAPVPRPFSVFSP